MTDMHPAVEAKTEWYLAKMPAVLRKAVLENLADLLDELAPERNPRYSGEQDAADDAVAWEAWDAALAEFTDDLRSTLVLDPEPYVDRNGERWHNHSIFAEKFKPRAGYSKKKEDYS